MDGLFSYGDLYLFRVHVPRRLPAEKIDLSLLSRRTRTSFSVFICSRLNRLHGTVATTTTLYVTIQETGVERFSVCPHRLTGGEGMIKRARNNRIVTRT